MLTDPPNFSVTMKKLKELASKTIEMPTGLDRIFFARSPTRKKKLENHVQIQSAAAIRGFEIVYPEDLPFPEQMRLAHHARHVIAPDGSNGLLSFFASPGSKVCFLNNPHTMPLGEINGLLAALGAEFTVFTGPDFGEPKDEPYWNDYRIDETKFASFLDDWLAD
jgi:capsular polysaccharide biosynthesis protein